MAADSPPAAVADAGPRAPGDGRFLDHLASAADMVGARRYREAEVEVLRGLSIAPSDLRALKLLALVRFKLGRLEEARTVCREIAATLPRDAGIRLKLGLIALKLDRADEAVHELELAARLAPDNLRAWTYLGFAYARRGERARAASAFRRAGQEEHAQEAERGASSFTGPGAAVTSPSAAVESAFEAVFDLAARLEAPEPGTDPDAPLAPLSARAGTGRPPVTPLSAFAVSRLAPATGGAAWVGATARLAVAEEVQVYVRQDAAVACAGDVRWEDAHRRVRGRNTSVRLGGASDGALAASFVVVHGKGDVFVAAPAGRLVPLSLDDDTLYVREDRVLAFEGSLAWESGTVPRSGLRMLQFRGHGLVALALTGEPGAVKVMPERPVFTAPSALLGWVGNVIALGGGGPGSPGGQPGRGEAAGGPFSIACEGEGVVLMDVAPRSDKEGA